MCFRAIRNAFTGTSTTTTTEINTFNSFRHLNSAKILIGHNQSDYIWSRTCLFCAVHWYMIFLSLMYVRLGNQKNISDSANIERPDTWIISLILSFLMDEFSLRYIYCVFFSAKKELLLGLYMQISSYMLFHPNNRKLNLNLVFLSTYTYVIKENINTNMSTLGLYLEYCV